MIPETLKPNDLIAIVSTARAIDQSELQLAIQLINERGYRVKLGVSIGARNHQFAGDDEFRANDLNAQIADTEVKAILFARGGYGTARIVDSLHLETLKKQPKWLCGYSDLTVLLNHVYTQIGLCGLHAEMPLNFGKEGYESGFDSLFNALENKQISYNFPQHPLNSGKEISGTLVGGNLSVLYSMLGSNSMPDFAGKLLLLEDLDEYKYHIDRMMLGLKRAGILNKLNGILVGGFTSMRDNAIPFGLEAEEIIAYHAKSVGVPVFFNVPAGHVPANNALMVGGFTRVIDTANGIVLTQDETKIP